MTAAPAVEPRYPGLLGHSGCELEFLHDRVIKRARGPAAARLAIQAGKQRLFRDGAIRAPRILSETATPDRYEFAMERVDGVLLFDLADSRIHLRLIQRWLRRSMAASKVRTVPSKVFADKVRSVWEAIQRNSLLKIGGRAVLERVCTDMVARCKRRVWRIPVGPCHGDFTFCNLICSPLHVHAVDFLNPFVDSPLLDMVKLRQDTLHGWVRLFVPVKPSILDAVDRQIHGLCSEYPSYNDFFGLLDVINILRILPYAKEDRVVRWCISEVKHAHADLDVRG